jgi:hypothetical protein
MSKPPPKPRRHKYHEPPEDTSRSSVPEPIEQTAETPTSTKPIAILAEREIPFEEERPPNFSPHFQIRVHRVRRREQPEEEPR